MTVKFTFLKLLEVQEMSPRAAIAVFKNLGATKELFLNPDGLKTFRNRKMRSGLHTDIGGNQNAAADLNAAYDSLKNGVSQRDINIVYGLEPDDGYTGAAGTTGPVPPTREPTPIWAMAGYSGGAPPNANIYRQNYTDLNYIKKQMYYMSKDDPEQQVYHVDAFDGYFFRGALSTYASPKIFAELAQAMIMWNSHGGNPYATRAVFVQKRNDRSKVLYLIYADGKYYNNNPIPFEHDSFNANAGNDQQFLRRLPEMLDKLRETGSI